MKQTPDDMLYPSFEIEPENVQILNEPNDYYEYLKKMFSEATERIVISSLYLGTGVLEKELVQVIKENLERNKELKVKVLFDYSRGLRNEENSATVLQDLLHTYPDRCKLYLYHTPKLRGIWKRILPQRIEETIGVMHMKMYLADDNMLITGANLSRDYFVDRQDRYMVLKSCAQLCDFYSLLFDIVKDFSFEVGPTGAISFNNMNKRLHPYLGIYSEFCNAFSEQINSLYRSYTTNKSSCMYLAQINSDPSEDRAFIIPLVQNGHVGVRIDEHFTNNIISSSSKATQFYMATGYFNLTPNYINRILTNAAQFKILTTSALGNGFYGSKGFSRYIPDLYTCIEKNFYDLIIRTKQQTRVKIFEYYRDKWTFHAKGVWYVPNAGDGLPTLTIIGSSNFGHRSVHRDLEFQLAIFSKNKPLQQQLLKEKNYIYQNAKVVASDPSMNRISIWITMLSKVFKRFL